MNKTNELQKIKADLIDRIKGYSGLFPPSRRGGNFNLTRMARAAGMTPPELSRVLNGLARVETMAAVLDRLIEHAAEQKKAGKR